MLRFVLSSLSVSVLILSASQTVMAHPEFNSEAQAQSSDLSDFKMPSEADIEAIIDKMPDFNGIMNDLSKVMKDDRLRSQMETTAKSFSKSIEDSGAFNTNSGELPDFNLAIESLLRSFADKDGLGGMVNTITDMAETMGDSLEKHIPENSTTKD